MDIKDPPRFLKKLKEYFYQLKSKGKGLRQFIKFHLLYNAQIEDIIETLKEEFGEIKLYIKPQAV